MEFYALAGVGVLQGKLVLSPFILLFPVWCSFNKATHSVCLSVDKEITVVCVRASSFRTHYTVVTSVREQ
jgi:hypothetical protein